MYYKVGDNSYCININTGNYASLVQGHDDWYSPDKDEDGALFEVVSKPYEEEVYEFNHYYGRKTFINVKSSLTGNVYRVLYYEHNLYYITNIIFITIKF